MGSAHSSTTSGVDRTSAPLGIKIICVLGAIVTIFTFFISFRIMAAGGPFVSLGLLFVFLGLAYLVVLYGLWTLQPWGWTWAMIVFIFGAIMDLVQVQILGLLISLVIIGYVYSKKELYRAQRE